MNPLKFCFLIVFHAATLIAIGQAGTSTEAEIKKLEQEVVTAILHADTNMLKQLWAPEFMVNNPRNNISANRDEVLKIQRAGLIDYSSFERVIEQMQFHEDMVITMGSETFISKNDIPGAKAGQTYKRRFTNIWLKRKGTWLQIARHASIICQ